MSPPNCVGCGEAVLNLVGWSKIVMRFELYAWSGQVIPSRGSPLGWIGPWKTYHTFTGAEQGMETHYMKIYPHYTKWKIRDRFDNSESVFA
jgi:hypothetical protein